MLEKLCKPGSCSLLHLGGFCGTVDSKSALRSAGALLSRVRAPPPVSWPDGGPESLRSPRCGLAIHKKLKKLTLIHPCRMLPKMYSKQWRKIIDKETLRNKHAGLLYILMNRQANLMKKIPAI
ncbi:hypothetical protein PoB_005280600 [Plakobranchus ocellatus]|uniref:Uncharacterized protein n=1 Tax=Plakobranchus ocellatus TaxID=259542 RepID=A0AAV4C0L5_9GAST|nr:hypothetical protein PoB_005280600 [Plakobranchus ocellatus]